MKKIKTATKKAVEAVVEAAVEPTAEPAPRPSRPRSSKTATISGISPIQGHFYLCQAKDGAQFVIKAGSHSIIKIMRRGTIVTSQLLSEDVMILEEIDASDAVRLSQG